MSRRLLEDLLEDNKSVVKTLKSLGKILDSMETDSILKVKLEGEFKLLVEQIYRLESNVVKNL